MSVLVTIVALGVALFVWLRASKMVQASKAETKAFETQARGLWDDREHANQHVVALKAELERERARLGQQLAASAAELEGVRARLAQIDALGPLEDALAYAAQMRAFAEQELEAAREERTAAQANSVWSRNDAEQERQRVLQQAQAEKLRLVSEAERTAREIAGTAYDLSQRAGELKKTVQALENKIKGYGLDYVMPTSLLLDELQERYGFSDAGARLQEARKVVTQMVKAGRAATCDYVEANRRETAVSFVLDAFNGKVESILSAVKHDNYGTLKQRIFDAFQLVNHLGEAFRNARVEQAYLDAQILVLQWSVAIQELKRQEKEEQRAMREQMREEEKARKEFEKALKESARDEEVARKAVDKVRADLEKAGEGERAKLEAKLAELSERLQAAEERGQRALSMAQQTRAGNVYVISNVGSFGENVFKIGMTRRLDPEDRVRELGDASVPFSFDIHAMIQTDDAPTLEKALHRTFLLAQVNKVNARKEFFRLSIADIKREVERMGIQASWTLTAACQEWRESQAIELKVAQDAGESRRWVESQIREHDRVVEQELVGAEEVA